MRNLKVEFKMQNIAYILGILFIAGACWITYLNSPKYAYFILIIAIFSLIIAQIKSIQLFSLLGIVAGFVIMVKSQTIRKREVETWFSSNGFQSIEVSNAADLFSYNTTLGTNIYTAYQAKVNEIPFVFGIKYHSHRSGNISIIEFYCSYYFYQNIDLDTLELQYKRLKEQTPHTNLFKSQFGYFDLKDCEIFRLKNGAVVVSWRVPDSVAGYEERYEWIKKALNNF